jgi:hypothetical protein
MDVTFPSSSQNSTTNSDGFNWGENYPGSYNGSLWCKDIKRLGVSDCWLADSGL